MRLRTEDVSLAIVRRELRSRSAVGRSVNAFFASLVALVASTAQPSPLCTVRGEHVDLGQVHVAAGGRQIVLAASDVAVSMRPALGQSRRVRVESPLRFLATAEKTPFITR